VYSRLFKVGQGREKKQNARMRKNKREARGKNKNCRYGDQTTLKEKVGWRDESNYENMGRELERD